ncbi:hypothetical protein IP81_07130 [Novosphingobium sp. AAP83]|uniref:EthD domain-containing protein n=1 Tax=Novosphingobium sp. AAP83 TaxID=1523425 RepID=UPI0006CD7C88|nr:EthD domain-containing protein [Novosphingobium sp. AAP83]KPF91842.1 hypothetical protein IP81_07130 [Novosphingobium sp. AAP83]
MTSDPKAEVHKLLLFMKRRPDISVGAFREYYETRHMPLCMRYMRGATRYFRRYLEPVEGMAEPEFDVITELWFTSRAPVDAIIATLRKDAMPPDVIADELEFIDRAKSRFYAVSEVETDLGDV